MAGIKDKIFFGDTETTGLNLDESQVLSMTLETIDTTTHDVVDGLSLKLGFRGDVRPEPGAIVATGINPFRHKGLSEADAADRLKNYLERTRAREMSMGGQNIFFDKLRLRNLLSRNGYDAHLIPLAEVDLMKEAVRAIHDGRLPLENLDERTLRDGSLGRSLKLASIVRATGGTVDPSRQHDDAYDVEISKNGWRSFGSPLVTEVSPVNNPYVAQRQFAGKIVKVKEWARRDGRFEENSYYVCGVGAGDVFDSFGKQKYNKTVMIRVGTPAFEDAVERARTDRITATSLKEIAVERGFGSDDVVAFDVVTPSAEDEAKIDLIRRSVVEYVEGERRKNRQDDFVKRRSAASEYVYNLKDPANNDTLISNDDEALIPELSRALAGKSVEELVKAVEDRANAANPPKGLIWAHALRVMIERYGYRNGLPGYEEARARALARIVPPRVTPVEHTRAKVDLSGADLKALNDAGADALSIECDGSVTRARIVDETGQTIRFEEIAHRENGYGKLEKPTAAMVSEMVQRLLDCSNAAANRLRKGFEAFSDDVSFDALKRQFRAEIRRQRASGQEEKARVLEETLGDMGETFEDFVRASGEAARSCRVEGALSSEVVAEADIAGGDLASPEEPAPRAPRKRRPNRFDSLRALLSEAGRVREEIEAAYAAEPSVVVPGNASNMDRVLANLNSPSLVRKSVDMAAYRAGLAPGGFDQGAAANLETAELGESEPSEVSEESMPALAALPSLAPDAGDAEKRRGRKSSKMVMVDNDAVAQCKVCRKWVKAKNAVSGMGPTCAKRLRTWLERPDTSTNEISKPKFKKVGELKEAGVYPIMLVRDAATGREFAADIIRREKDGRYLVIDLSQIARDTASGRQDTMREAVRIFLDATNHEVAKVFGRGNHS